MSSLPQRKRLRHKSYDYHRHGAYFVTLCVEEGQSLLGHGTQEGIALNDAGKMVAEVWLLLPQSFPGVVLDSFVVMPNHLHFVLWLADPVLMDDQIVGSQVRVQNEADTKGTSLPNVMQWFKSFTTAKYRHGVNGSGWPRFPGRLWQRGYYDHIVRSEEALFAIRRYIQMNPVRWQLDRYHPNPSGPDLEAVALWELLKADDRTL